MEELAALDGRGLRPASGGFAGGGDGRIDLLRGRECDRGDRLLRVWVLDLERVARSGNLFPADEQPRLGHGRVVSLARSSSTAPAKTALCFSTSASVVAGEMSAMLWNGVKSTPRLSA